MPEIKEIIADADNTIWPWTRFAAIAYPAMAQEIARQTGKTIQQVEHGMKTYYTRTGTIESPWLIQDLQKQGFFDELGWTQEQIDQLRDDAHRVFLKKRHWYFRMYKGVKRVFKRAHKEGIKIHILTDAPTIQACMRIQRTKIGKYISSVHALKFNDDRNEPPPKVKERQEAGYYDVPFDVFELEHEKPDTRLEDIIHAMEETHGDLREYIENYVAIWGDNPKKDMALATKYGCLGLYADYGTPDKDELAVLGRIAPEKVMKKNTSTQGQIDLSAGNIVTIGKNSIRKDVYTALGFTNGHR